METEVDAREPVATPSAAVSAAPDIEENVEIGPSASDLAVESDEDAAEAVINGSNGHGDEAEDAIRIESRQEDESAELVVQEDGKRVKVYELRDQSWHDRGTGQCKGIYDDSQDLALLVVEAEDVGGDKDQGGFLKEELLLSAKVERADIYARQQDTLIVWTEPSGLDIALSFQDAEGCEDIWQFILEVQRHLNNLPSDSDNAAPPTSSPLSASPMPLNSAPVTSEHLPWETPTLANIREQAQMLHLQMRSAFARDRVVEHILTEEYIKNLLGVFEQAEDLESLEDLHTLHDVMQNIILLNDNSILEYVLQDEIFEGVIGMLEYDRDFPSIKTSFRQLFREISKFRQVVEIWDVGIRNKIHQTYRLQYLKEVVLSRVLDDSIFNILNGFIFFNQVDIIGHLVQNDDILVELFAYFKDGQDEAKQRDAVLFLHQLMLMSKVIQLANRVALYRALSEKGLTSVIEWAFQRQEAAIVHAAAEMLTIKAEHDSLGLRRQIVQDNDAKRPQTLMTVIIRLHERTSNTGLLSQLTDVIRVLLEPPADNDTFPRKDTVAPEAFLNYFYESCCADLFRPLVELPDVEPNSDLKLDRKTATQIQHLIELLYYCITNHTARAAYFVQTTVVNKKIMSLLYLRDKPLRLVVTRYLKSCFKTGNVFLIKRFIKNDLLAPLIAMLEAESRRDNMLTSACMTIFDDIRKDNLKGVINYLFEKYPARLDALAKRPFFRTSIQALHDRYEQINEKQESRTLDKEDFAPDAEARQAQWFAESDEEEAKPVAPKRKRPVGPTLPQKRRSPKAGPSGQGAGAGIGQSALGLDYDDSSDNDSTDGSPSRPKVELVDAGGDADVDMDKTSEPEIRVEVKSEPELAAELNDVAEQMRKKREREDDEEEFGLIAKKQDDKRKVGSPNAAKKHKDIMGDVDKEKETGQEQEKEKDKKDKEKEGGPKVKLNWSLNPLKRFGSGKKALLQSATSASAPSGELGVGIKAESKSESGTGAPDEA